jgi:hypothetical protein
MSCCVVGVIQCTFWELCGTEWVEDCRYPPFSPPQRLRPVVGTPGRERWGIRHDEVVFDRSRPLIAIMLR